MFAWWQIPIVLAIVGCVVFLIQYRKKQYGGRTQGPQKPGGRIIR